MLDSPLAGGMTRSGRSTPELFWSKVKADLVYGSLTCESLLVKLLEVVGTLSRLELWLRSNRVARFWKVLRCQLPLLEVLSLRPGGAD